MEFWFVRHGESIYNAAGLFCGSVDAALTARGEQQGQTAADELMQVPAAWILASPMRRTTTTATYIAQTHGLDIETDSRLAEHCKGIREGTAITAMTSADWALVPGAETPDALYQRVKAALRDASKRDGLGIIVAHGGIGRTIETLRLGHTPAKIFDNQSRDNAAPHLVTIEDYRLD